MYKLFCGLSSVGHVPRQQRPHAPLGRPEHAPPYSHGMPNFLLPACEWRVMCEARSTHGRRVVRSSRPAAVISDRNVGAGWAPQTTSCAYSGTGDGGGEGERARLRDADLEAGFLDGARRLPRALPHR